MTTLLDTNVLLDVLTSIEPWATWSERMIERCALAGPLVINDVVYAELSVGFERIEGCDAFLTGLSVEQRPMPRGALFLAGKAFLAHRRRGGSRPTILPDFFIGAHAAHDGLALLTRAPRRYRRAFPTLRLIAPDG